MEYNSKIVMYNNDIQTVFYNKKYERKEKNEKIVKRAIKNNKSNTEYNMQGTWYNSKTNQVELVPYGYQVIKHPYQDCDMLFPLNKFLDENIFIDMDFDLMDKYVQRKILEERERNDIRNKFRSFRRTKQNIYNICRANEWDLFVTITIADTSIRFDLDKCKKLILTKINSLRTNKKLDFGYFLIPEQHKNGAWHFHGLFNNIKGLTLNRAFTPSGSKVIYNDMQVYSIVEFQSIGFNSVTYVQNNQKVTRYITKYVTKTLFDNDVTGKFYLCSRGLKRGKEVFFDVENEDELLLKVNDVFGYVPTLTHGKKVYNPYKECEIVYREYNL